VHRCRSEALGVDESAVLDYKPLVLVVDDHSVALLREIAGQLGREHDAHVVELAKSEFDANHLAAGRQVRERPLGRFAAVERLLDLFGDALGRSPQMHDDRARVGIGSVANLDVERPGAGGHDRELLERVIGLVLGDLVFLGEQRIVDARRSFAVTISQSIEEVPRVELRDALATVDGHPPGHDC
jgi:hypothetical protein